MMSKTLEHQHIRCSNMSKTMLKLGHEMDAFRFLCKQTSCRTFVLSHVASIFM